MQPGVGETFAMGSWGIVAALELGTFLSWGPGGVRQPSVGEAFVVAQGYANNLPNARVESLAQGPHEKAFLPQDASRPQASHDKSPCPHGRLTSQGSHDKSLPTPKGAYPAPTATLPKR